MLRSTIDVASGSPTTAAAGANSTSNLQQTTDFTMSAAVAVSPAVYDQHFSSSRPENSVAPTISAREEFVCNVCQKAFEKRTSRDRHTRRCRKKRPEDAIPRKKSCSHCANSKARCDQRRPQCTRCRTKALSCHYIYQASPPELDLGSYDQILLHDVDMNMGGDIFGWGGGDTGCTPLHEHQQVAIRRSPSCTLFPSPSSESLRITTPSLTLSHSSCSGSPESTYDFDLVAAGLSSQTRASSQDCTTLIIPRNPIPQTNAYPQIDLIDRLLSSFAALLKKPTTPHPFIHRQRLLPGKRAAALANVTALVHMAAVKQPENKSFVSSMIRAEWDRLDKLIVTNETPADWDQVEYFQAMVVLALVRVVDGDLELRDLNVLENCGTRIGFSGLFADPGKPPAPAELKWEEWLLVESKRRTFITLFLLDRVYYFKNNMTPYMCDGLSAVQLPACRSVWEAPREEQWEEESMAVRTWPGWEGKRGEWITLRELWDGSSRMSVFYAGMDVLGTCLMADAVVRTGEGMKQAQDM